MRVSKFLCSLLVGISATLNAVCQAQQTESASQLIVHVKDTDHRPIPNATATVFRWTGKMEPSGLEAVTDGSGRATIMAIPAGEMLYLGIRADQFAATHQMITLNVGENHEQEVILAKPVTSWIQVNRPDGSPVQGAEFQRLDFVDANDKQVVVTADTLLSLSASLTGSDQSGRLLLPPIPAGAKVTAWVAHDDWKLAKLEGLIANDGELRSVQLQPGVPVKLTLVCEGIDAAAIERQRIKVILFPANGGSSGGLAVMRTIEVRDGQISFTAHKEDYDSLRLSHERFFIAPSVENSIRRPNQQLDLRDKEGLEMTALVRPRVKAAGRVIDESGKPLRGVSVYSSVSNVGPTSSNDEFSLSEFGSGDFAETDADGRFELDVAPGAAEIETIHQGFYANPVTYRFLATASGVNEIPPISLLPVPTLCGQVLSESEQPVRGAIVRMRSAGYGDADPVGMTDEHGRFDLPLSRIPYRADGQGLQTDVFVVAIDSKTNTAGIATVNLTDAKAVNAITVPVLAQAPDWILHPLPDHPGTKKTEAELAARRKLHADKTEQFPAGKKGEMPPDLSQGTWLNSPARSLKDLRGQFVLLDFWFIGCGPCHADLPTVKATYNAFRERGFTVVSVHINSQSPEAVAAYAKEHGMDFPIVVDNSEGTLSKDYDELGVSGYPSYLLIDPNGKVLINDNMEDPDQPSLRLHKTEAVFHALQTWKRE